MDLTVGEVLNLVSDAKTKKEKVEILKKNDSSYLRQYLKLNFDKNIKFSLPEGEVPYKKSNAPTGYADTTLAMESRRMYLFLEGGFPELKQNRREELFIQLMESLDNQEAEILEQVKDKKLKGVTLAAIKEAYPTLELGELE